MTKILFSGERGLFVWEELAGLPVFHFTNTLVPLPNNASMLKRSQNMLYDFCASGDICYIANSVNIMLIQNM